MTMVATIDDDAMSHDDRTAWINSMSAVEQEVLFCPAGYRYTMIIAAFVKRALVTIDMTAGERLHMLEQLTKMVDRYFTHAALAAIKPAGATFAAMVVEAQKLGDKKSFVLLTSWDVFNALLRHEPSLLEAIQISGNRARPSISAAGSAGSEQET
jgi:hypothetical protein